MSDLPNNASGGDQLFKNMDEQERIYAPEQVPDTVLPGEERDVGGTAGQGTARASADGDVHGRDTEPGRANIAGAEGDQSTAPVIPVRPEIGITQPVPTPVVPRDDQLDDNNR